jgi:hypothetical protein
MAPPLLEPDVANKLPTGSRSLPIARINAGVILLIEVPAALL